MRSYLTSYNGLFQRGGAELPAIDRIEIPLIQRDYAQGRTSNNVERIRRAFLDVLHAALCGGERVSLDFVYGDVDGGTLRPLDGQQRLTTLFLLHWYLASRAGRLGQEQGWKQFSYATRASARLFCERLAVCQPPASAAPLSAWLEDQSWFLHMWKHDPTIQSMLVMLDTVHDRFRDDDCVAAWGRLVDTASPAISFHLLPIEGMGLSDDLYIKMNSRGKPLTEFENFKARFEKDVESSCPERVAELALRIDGPWADVLWPYHGGDHVVDDEFMRYFQFVTEVAEWRRGRLLDGEITTVAERIYGTGTDAPEQVDFLIRAFDTWVGVDVSAFFHGLLTRSSEAGSERSKVLIFGSQGAVDVDLFARCCRDYGTARGRSRVFTVPDTLMLYAILLHRFDDTPDVARRLRLLRNLLEASSNELRLDRMPGHLADVSRVIVDGTLDGIASFNHAQLAHERDKRELISRSPELELVVIRLEDHALLRGALSAFDLDVEAEVFERRAGAFARVFDDATSWRALTGALLAIGDHALRTSAHAFQLGSGSNSAPWRDLFAATTRANLGPTRTVLGALLDLVADHEGPLAGFLEGIASERLASNAAWGGEDAALDWRYYFVKYPEMREGRSGIYVIPDATEALGYDICMLDKTRMSSWYRDPYLLAIWRESGVGGAVEDPWFTGYATEPRWLRLAKSGAGLRCVEQGIALQPPTAEHLDAFARVTAAHGVGADFFLHIPQVRRGLQRIDTRDRVQLASAILQALVSAGL